MSSLSLPSLLLVVVAFIPNVAAAGLNLNPTNTATFSLYVILAAYTLFQAVRAFGILRRPQPKGSVDDDPIPPERVPYAKIFLGTLTLIACYVLQTVWIPVDLSKDSLGADLHNTYYGMIAADQLSDIFIASALLHFIDHRRDVLGRTHKDNEPSSVHYISSARKRLLDTVLLAIMAIFIVAEVIVGTVLVRTLSNPDVVYQAYVSLYHVYIAFYIVATLDVTLSAFFLWRGLSRLVAVTEKVRPV